MKKGERRGPWKLLDRAGPGKWNCEEVDTGRRAVVIEKVLDRLNGAGKPVAAASAPASEPRAPSPEPRAPSPEPRAPSPEPGPDRDQTAPRALCYAPKACDGCGKTFTPTGRNQKGCADCGPPSRRAKRGPLGPAAPPPPAGPGPALERTAAGLLARVLRAALAELERASSET